jgi:hypothetical protein
MPAAAAGVAAAAAATAAAAGGSGPGAACLQPAAAGTTLRLMRRAVSGAKATWCTPPGHHPSRATSPQPRRRPCRCRHPSRGAAVSVPIDWSDIQSNGKEFIIPVFFRSRVLLNSSCSSSTTITFANTCLVYFDMASPSLAPFL